MKTNMEGFCEFVELHTFCTGDMAQAGLIDKVYSQSAHRTKKSTYSCTERNLKNRR